MKKIDLTEKNILVTGGAGFIGSHLVEKLLTLGNTVTVIDNFNDYYDPRIKHANIDGYKNHEKCIVIQGDIRNSEDLDKTFFHGPFDTIIHLAAMAGVRPSLENPRLYAEVNVQGTQNLLDYATRQEKLPLFVFASSSSVYGEREAESFLETDRVDRPISPYAATKVAGELICHAAHAALKLNVVCLRFFTVFGPRQRPDLAIHKFCRLIENDIPIEMYGDGTSQRDYTYIGDIVNGIIRVTELKDPGFEILNLGRSKPVTLKEMIEAIELSLGKEAIIKRKPMQKGDVSNTFASIDKARKLLGYEPETSFEEGIKEFVDWYRATVKDKDCALTK